MPTPVADNGIAVHQASEAGPRPAPVEYSITAASADVDDDNETVDVDEWVSAIKDLQQKTLDAHLAFLHMAEQSMQELTELISGQSTDVVVDPVETASASVQRVMAPPPALPRTTEKAAGPPPSPFTNGYAEPESLAAPTIGSSATEPPVPTPEAPTPTSAAPVTPTPEPVAPTPAPASNELHETMLAVVTEKTGYPTEMLEPGMSLANDLGIDSIKRVEILAAMRERVPSLPEFDPTEMGALNTLGEIVDYMNAQLGSNGGAPHPRRERRRPRRPPRSRQRPRPLRQRRSQHRRLQRPRQPSRRPRLHPTSSTRRCSRW